LKMALTTAMNSKPAGCSREVWATELVLVNFELTFQKEKKHWLLSSKMGHKWLSKREDITPKIDRAIKKAARYVMLVTTNYERPPEEDYSSSDDEAVMRKKLKKKATAQTHRDEMKKIAAEAEESRKAQLRAKWKKESFKIVKMMSGKDHHHNELEDMVFLNSSDEEDEEESLQDWERQRKAIVQPARKSVQFDRVVQTNAGDVYDVPLPPLKQSPSKKTKTMDRVAGGMGGRHLPSAYTPPSDEGVAAAIAQRREPTTQILGLKCSNLADPKMYVEVKPLCARHFLCRDPPAPPPGKKKRKKNSGGLGDAEEALNPSLVCVSHFGTQESQPVPICAGGAPPGYQADSFRFHISPHFTTARFNLYQAPHIPIGYVLIDLEEKANDLSGGDFKTFVADIIPTEGMGVDERMGRGGYFGQFAITLRKVLPPVTLKGGMLLDKENVSVNEVKQKTKNESRKSEEVGAKGREEDERQQQQQPSSGITHFGTLSERKS